MGATTISSAFLSAYLLLLCLVCSLKVGYVFGRRENIAESHHLQHNYSIQFSSLLPSSFCSPSTKALDKKAAFPLVRKDGPCSQLHQDKANIPTVAKIILLDEARVKSIHSKLAKINPGSTNVKQTDATTLPLKDGIVVGSPGYIVTIGLGTPKKDLSLLFDTGSSITWTQCQPCTGSCYKQKDPIFSPSESSTYTNVSCDSDVCRLLGSVTGSPRPCAQSTCVYGVGYADKSFSIGFFAIDKLTLTSTDVLNFLFGCGQDNQGQFNGVAGVLGLGRKQLSVLSQHETTYNKFFSYCLPSSASSTGFLTFGDDGISTSVKFMPLSTKYQGTSFYGIDLIGISVGAQKLPIPVSIFTTAGAIIDSGTDITRLPPTVYAALRSEFRRQMSQYPMVGSQLPPLDTCYDFKGYPTVNVPLIRFFFSGDFVVPIHNEGIFIGDSPSEMCLAFLGNDDDTEEAVFGGIQQKTLQVVYDGAGERIGFATGGCT
ncbi:hypothetical protein DITRI_Ditri10aG0139700 [Diplodiscus trichospermus]